MKTIFLDIDGVLNSEKEIHEWIKNNPGIPCPDFYDLLPSKVKLLKDIVIATGAGIVLSSSWRCSNYSRQQIINMCKENHIRYLSQTKDGVFLHKQDESKATRRYREGKYTHDRGAEILEYIKRHKIKDNYIIIDDEIEDIETWIDHSYIVHTDMWYGLTEVGVQEAIQKLNDCKKN